MAKKTENKEFFEENYSKKVRSSGEPITFVTKNGKKVTYLKNRQTSLIEEENVELVEKENEKEPKEKVTNIMISEDDGFDHINANVNEGLDDEQVIFRIKEGFINESVHFSFI